VTGRIVAKGGSRARVPETPPPVAPKVSPQLPTLTDQVEARSSQLQPFASYYPAAKHPPTISSGQTVDTFTEAQARAIFRAYWEAPPTADLPALVTLAKKDPALKGHAFGERQVGRLFSSFPDAFPWGWRSRVLAATSHALVDALLGAPEGTSLTQVLAQLERTHGGFPTISAMSRAAKETWPAEPERFPFAKALPHGKDGFQLVARGPKNGIRRDGHERWAMTPDLAQRVFELTQDPEIRYDWSFARTVRHLDEKLGGGFSGSTFDRLHEKFGDILPSFQEIHRTKLEGLCQEVRRLYDDEGIREAKEMVAVLHQRYNYPKWSYQQLSYFRGFFPDIVPDFRADKDAEAYGEARTFIDAVKKRPDDTYLEVGASLGFSGKRVNQLLSLIHARLPEELEKAGHGERWTLADKRVVEAALADAPLNATVDQVYRILKHSSPELFERHPLASSLSLYPVLRQQLDIDSFRLLQQRRYAEVLADFARRSPVGTSFTELVHLIQDEYPGAYSMTMAKRLAQRFKSEPEEFPAIQKILDPKGAFPWEKSKIRYTEALAKKVTQAIEAHPQASLRQIVNDLREDPGFKRDYPTFHADQIAYLRSKFPEVPFVDDLQLRGQDARRAFRRNALDQLAERVRERADEVPDHAGLTIAGLARALKVRPDKIARAIHHRPELFPWYNERPAGTIDLYLATRVAHEMERAPLGTTLSEIVAGLKTDPNFHAEYPAFNYHTIHGLRERYPDLVPDWQNRGAILRSKLLVDALLAAEPGAPFAAVAKQLEAQYPGQFSGRWADPAWVASTWRQDPELYGFTEALAGTKGQLRLEGRGQPAPKTHETAAQLASRLAKLEQINDHLPLLDKLAAGVKSTPFAEFECLAIQHLVGPKVALLETMHRLGLSPGRTTVVGIPYSTSQPVADTLVDKGYDVRVPPLDLEAWYQEVKASMEERIASAKKSGKRILVMDDGGLVAMMFERYPELAQEAHRFTIVEQTTRGITVADGIELKSSVISVAESWGKFVEGPMIGDKLGVKLEARLRGIGVQDLKGKHVGLTGYGTIGEPLARELQARGAIVTILDTDDNALLAAAKAGFKTARAAPGKERQGFFEHNDIIIGASGKRSIFKDDLAHLKKGAILGSASSKLVEIEVEALGSGAKKGGKRVVDSTTFPPTVRYSLKDGREVTLLASGYPLNFDGDVISIEPEKIQLTMGLLLIGALQAIRTKAAGVHRLDPEKQLEVLREFEEVGGVLASGEKVAAAKAIAMSKLEEMKLRHGSPADRRHRRAER